MEDRLPVLIIGAGPTGLLMACELARQGVAFRIIDKTPKPTLASNAVWVQPRTIEIFDLLGIASPFVKLGHHCNGIHLHSHGKLSIHVPLNQIKSKYPYILMLPQSETERVLNEHLATFKCHVERPLELIKMQQNEDSVTATIRHENGQVEEITSDWLIGCDGANSFVREQCKIYFPGEDLPEQFVVADAQMDSFHAHNEIHLFFDKKTLFIASPLGKNKYRILANLHQSHPRKFFIEKEIREIVAERTYGSYNVHSVSWIMPFWIHSKAVSHMQKGRIFLAGDAAHIHSPAGGQGMNAGMQDSYNLAWKLALVIKHKAKPALLDTYQIERQPVIKELVNETEYLTKMALFDNHFLSKLNKFHHKLLKGKKKIIPKIANQITQLTVQYKQSPIIKYNDKSIKKKLKPGLHAPDVHIEQKTWLYGYFHNTKHNVLLFTGVTPEKSKLTKLLKIQRWLHQTFPDLIKTHIVSSENLQPVENGIHDVNGVIHTYFNVKYPCIYIIRPDNFIAYYSRKLDQSSIAEFLHVYLL